MKRTMSVENQKGRPREFDLDQALEAAMRVFWAKGYDGASLADLEEAMGINRPSLYAAFGNKEELFKKALERYSSKRNAYTSEMLERPTARKVVEALLQDIVKAARTRSNPTGCMLVRGAMSCSEATPELAKAISHNREVTEAALRKRFKRAIAEGDLPKDSDATALARYVQAVNVGMAVQASMGASAADLKRVADTVLTAWPTKD